MQGSERSNKKKQLYKIILYKGRKDNKHYFDITFNTGNKELVTYQQIKNGTCYDTRADKLEKQLRTKEQARQRAKQRKAAKSTYDLSRINESKVLSVDLATLETGLCHAEGGIIKESYHLSVPKDRRDRTTTERAFWMAQSIARCIDKLNIDYLLLEDTFSGLNTNVSKVLSEARGLLLYEVMKRDIRYEVLPPALWKNQYPELKGLKRAEQKKAGIELANAFMGRELTEDQADATLMLKAALEIAFKDKESINDGKN